jgi:hypothetical protein
MVTSFFGEVHPTSKRPPVSNDFQACSKTNNRAPLTRLAPPRDNEWRRSDVMATHHLRHDRAAPKTRDAPKALCYTSAIPLSSAYLFASLQILSNSIDLLLEAEE